jgi:hypothetical protein
VGDGKVLRVHSEGQKYDSNDEGKQEVAEGSHRLMVPPLFRERYFELSGMASVFGEVEETEEEEGAEEVEHPVFGFGAAGEELDEGVAGKAEAQAVGDGPA